MYHLIKRACTGHKKLLKGKCSQDALKSVQLKDACIVAVADGHGDSAHCFSDKGALFATESTVEVLREIYAKVPLKELYAHFLQNRESIYQQIVKRWNMRCLNDYAEKNPNFGCSYLYPQIKESIDEMFEKKPRSLDSKNAPSYFLKQGENEDGLKKVAKQYGTTLNAMFLTKDFVFCFGIGDGDLMFVQNSKAYWILPPSSQFSTATESLCYKPQRAVECFRGAVVRFDNKRKTQKQLFKSGINPDFMLVATDGFRNSFLSDGLFIDKLVEIAKGKKSGYSSFKAHSSEWIKTLTAESVYQDDITLCLIYK